MNTLINPGLLLGNMDNWSWPVLQKCQSELCGLSDVTFYVGQKYRGEIIKECWGSLDKTGGSQLNSTQFNSNQRLRSVRRNYPLQLLSLINLPYRAPHSALHVANMIPKLPRSVCTALIHACSSRTRSSSAWVIWLSRLGWFASSAWGGSHLPLGVVCIFSLGGLHLPPGESPPPLNTPIPTPAPAPLWGDNLGVPIYQKNIMALFSLLIASPGWLMVLIGWLITFSVNELH